MRILFFTDNFPPESNAPANRTYEHCIEWIKLGAEVTVITCNPNFPKGEIYPGHKNRLYRGRMMDGIRVIRVWTYITPNRGTFKRILDYMSFALTSFFASLFIKTDIIIATSPQLFTALGGYCAAVFKRKPWIMEVRDLWPESIHALGAINNKRILKKLEQLVTFLYLKADKIIVVTDSFKERISGEGIDSSKIEIVKNGVNHKRYFPQPSDDELIRQHELEGKFVVGYIGTHGLAHNLDMILNAAARVQNPHIHFLLVGEGAMKKRLLKQCERLSLTNVTMLNMVHSREVNRYISITDCALVPLKKSETFKTVIPSKIFENSAMGKPILLGVEGESKALVEAYQAGLTFKPDSIEEFISKLDTLQVNPDVVERLAEGGLKLAADFGRAKLARLMLKYIVETYDHSKLTKSSE
ncbi:MAG: glycosyltransferase family 4 protein [Roseivirga sp.]